MALVEPWIRNVYIRYFEGEDAIKVVLNELPSFSGYEKIRVTTDYRSRVRQIRIIGVTPKEFFNKL